MTPSATPHARPLGTFGHRRTLDYLLVRKAIYSPDAINGPTDATALRHDSNYSSFSAEVPF